MNLFDLQAKKQLFNHEQRILRLERGSGGSSSGNEAVSPVIDVSKEGKITTITIEDAEGVKTATILDGENGAPGEDGVGIKSVVQTVSSPADQGTNVVTVTMTDGAEYRFNVFNGSKGNKGDKGDPGAKGDTGETGPEGPQGETGDTGPAGPPGAEGKSAYSYARDGGYTGTEEQFALDINEAAGAYWKATKTEYGVDDIVHSNTSYSFTSNQRKLNTTLDLTAGWKYIVTFKGVQYECACHRGSDGNLYLGDETLFTGNGTGEYPFGITTTSIVKDTATEEIVTLKIVSEKVTEYRKLPVKFLPDEIFESGSGDSSGETVIGAPADWSVNDETAAGYVKNRTHWKETRGIDGVVLAESQITFKSVMNSITGIGSNLIVDGYSYIVSWNGVEYKCRAHMFGGSMVLGNDAISASGTTDTGEPFLIEAITETFSYITKENSTAETVTLSITGVYEEIYHKIPKDYLPDFATSDDINSVLNTVFNI